MVLILSQSCAKVPLPLLLSRQSRNLDPKGDMDEAENEDAFRYWRAGSGGVSEPGWGWGWG